VSRGGDRVHPISHRHRTARQRPIPTLLRGSSR
jgi:hypothetical protein